MAPEVKACWVHVFHLGGDYRGVRVKEKKNQGKTIKEEFLCLSSMWATGTQPRLGPSDKSYFLYSELLPEGLEAGAFILQPWIRFLLFAVSTALPA